MNIFLYLDLISVGVVIAATTILAFIVYLSNPKSITNRTFVAFSFITIVWGGINYASYHIYNQELALFIVRVSIFFAVWHSLFLFQMLYVFPGDTIQFPKSYTHALLPLVALTSLINLTPFTLKRIAEISSSGQVTKVVNGPGIALFTVVILGLIISGIWVLIKKIKHSENSAKKQAKPMLVGIIITFVLILVFNFIFPAFLNNSRYISLGAVFMFPFIVGTSYSIFKHRLLNVKIITTEILTFLLSVATLFEIVLSKSAGAAVARFAIFLLILGVGLLLDRSVRREVEQREQLQILSKQLADANEKLKALDQARAEFISIASHQLRTPPATVKWYLSALLNNDYGKIPKSIKEILAKTELTNNLLISLIEDMLNVSRIERGTLEFLFEPADVLSMAKTTVEQLEPLAAQKKLTLKFFSPPKPLPKINVDKEKLRQVINNLIDNAIKYSTQGQVEISLQNINGSIKFQVKDSGKGIPQNELKNIFKKYSRGKESFKHSPGLGLGLYVAKIVVEQHQGKIWAESKGEGQGATFCFTLPIQPTHTEHEEIDLAKKY